MPREQRFVRATRKDSVLRRYREASARSMIHTRVVEEEAPRKTYKFVQFCARKYPVFQYEKHRT